jgi:hypothetical protein
MLTNSRGPEIFGKDGGRVMRFANASLLTSLAALAVTGCSGNSATHDLNTVGSNVSNASFNDITTASNDVSASPVLMPDHHYGLHDGNAYGYIAAVSEDDRKKGKAAGDVVMVSYLGHWNGALHLAEVNDSGGVIANYECSNPCVAIKRDQYGNVQRFAYTPLSVIGGAFEDAMNGKLVEARPPAPSPTYAAPSYAPRAPEPTYDKRPTNNPFDPAYMPTVNGAASNDVNSGA